jgi:DNA-binding MarR family transcriptional regulator
MAAFAAPATGLADNPPAFAGSVPDLVVVAGGSNLSAYDLAAHFSDPDGDPLSFSTTIVGGYDALQAAVTLSLNGSRVDIRSANASWWGPLTVDFYASDGNSTTKSNNVTLHVLPAAAAAPETRTVTLLSRYTFLEVGCGDASYTERFVIPVDATITNASVALATGLNFTALGASVQVSAANAPLDSVNASALPTSLDLNASALNARFASLEASWGLRTLEIGVTACAITGIAEITVVNVSVTYTRGTWIPIGTVPTLLSIAVNGVVNGTVEAGAPVALEVLANGTLGAPIEVAWYVDGSFVGGGAVLGNLSLSPGTHRVEVRVSNGTSVQTYSVTVSAAARPPPVAIDLRIAALASVLGFAAFGVVVTRTESGRWLFFAVLAGSVFARLKKASLLDHFVRGTLYQVIRENPGIHFAELRRRANLANGAATHHLRMLEKGAYVRVVIDGTKTRFFTTERPLEAEVYGISDTDRAVLDAVAGSPGISQRDLALKVDRSASVVSRSVSRLVTLGYVTTTLVAGRVQVFPRLGTEGLSTLVPAWPDHEA